MPTDMTLYLLAAGVALLLMIFIVLAVLAGRMSSILEAVKKGIKTTKQTQNYSAPQPAPGLTPAVNVQENQKIVAILAAAIAEDMGTDVSHLRIHSIRKI